MPVGSQSLDRADRRAVVAVIGVVVVLDDQGAGALRPGDDRGAGVRREDRAGRPLVGGGEDHGVGSTR